MDVCSIKCTSEDCDKQTSAEYCALHARLKCDVEGYREEVDPPHSRKETIRPPATTRPSSECSRGSRKRVRHSEITSMASKRAISRESAGGAVTMLDVDGQKSPVERDNSVKKEVQLAL